MICKVFVIGNLGRDPEQKTFDDGNSIVNFPVATSENYKDKQGEWQSITEWHNISVVGRATESAMKLKKGDRVYLEGKLKTRSYEKDGEKRYVTEIKTMMVRNLTPKSESGGLSEPKRLDQDYSDPPF